MRTVYLPKDRAKGLPKAKKHRDCNERRSQKILPVKEPRRNRDSRQTARVCIISALQFSSLTPMKFATIFFLTAIVTGDALAADAARILPKVNPLPIALNDDFQFRKTKLFFLSETPAKSRKSALGSPQSAGIAEASMNFERTYRLYGAITGADQRQRFGNYFDFFWRAKRPGNVTVRLEYRQEKLRSFVQAREVDYVNVKGNRKTEFAVIGDDYFNDGRVIAWRCLLIENGHVVAENRSYLWE